MSMNGAMVTHRPVGETLGICCSSPIVRKNMLAYLLNCSNRYLGMKVMRLYLAVEILLLLNFSPCAALRRIFLGVSSTFPSAIS